MYRPNTSTARNRWARGLWLLAAVVFAAPRTAAAQDADTVAYPQWEIDLAARLGGSQAGYQNWREGGMNSLAANTQLTGTFERTSLNWLQSHDLRLGIGVVRQDTLEVRKAEDVIRLRSQISYQGESFFRRLSPMIAAGLRTQFAPGFSYDKNPFEDGRAPPVKVSDVFSPATLTQSVGLALVSEWGFQQRIGVGLKETIVLIDSLRSLYGLEPRQAMRFQVGLESQTEVDREIFENVQLKSALGLFAAFNQEELPDVLWENAVIMKVNRWLSADLEAVVLFDRDFSDKVQFKEILSIGISIALL